MVYLLERSDPAGNDVNCIHDWYCKSRRWKRLMVDRVLPDVLDGIDLEGRVLEIGPGPGLVTEALLDYGVADLTTVEIDPRAAESLRGRFGARVAGGGFGRVLITELDRRFLFRASVAV